MGTHTTGDDRLSRRGGAAASTAVALACGLGLIGAACGRPIAFTSTDIAAAKPLAGAPHNFFLGAATSAHQIEGGTHNDWTAWETGRYPDGSPHVRDGATTARAAAASSQTPGAGSSRLHSMPRR